MKEVTLLEAWRLWFSGNLPADTLLCGVRLFWWGVCLCCWGRAGKLLQLVGAAIIVADIIGTERLRVFGNSLHGRITLSSTINLFRDSTSFIILFLRSILTEDKLKQREIDQTL